MIIYGSKMYGVKNVVKGFGQCPKCGKYGKNRSYDGRKWGHIYFIPLIPEGKPVRVMRECNSCKMGSHVSQPKVRSMYRQIEEMMGVCIESAAAGSSTFEDPIDEREVANDSFLLEAVDLLYHAGHASELPDLIALLDTQASRYEHAVACGAFAEITGKDQDAGQAYHAACDTKPDRPTPRLLLADVMMRLGNAEEALRQLEVAEQLVPEDVQLMLAKLGPLEALGRYSELADLLDRAFDLSPHLSRNKALVKLRKKYGKKASKQGR